jgi:two-component system chemotaxis response regulator CheB
VADSTPQPARVRVLIVDDSALMRQILREILSSDPRLEVVGAVSNPSAAREAVLTLRPDVLTLDVEMPGMDGLTFLEKLMRARPMPVVMVSSLTERGCDTTLRALELGAVDFVSKPKLDLQTQTLAIANEIIEKVANAGRMRVRKVVQAAPVPDRLAAVRPELLFKGTYKVIAVGASTGGTEALRELLTSLPADSPGIVIVQHMPEKFTTAFANRLDSLCKIRVHEAADGDRILPGHALLAPGSFHMEVQRSGAEYKVRISQTAPVNRHRPSVDVLFHSCARYLGGNAVGVILTGMGDDGARGLLAMRQAGARTIAQDEATCVVYGMPGSAVAMGGVEDILPLSRIPQKMLQACSRP